MNSACLSTNFSTSQGQATRSTRGCSRVIHFISFLLEFLRTPHRRENDVIEAGDRIRFRPKTRSNLTECGVRRLDDELATHVAAKGRADHLAAQLLPDARRDGDGAALDLAAVSIHVLENDDVPFERVRPHDVVVPRVPDPQ